MGDQVPSFTQLVRGVVSTDLELSELKDVVEHSQPSHDTNPTLRDRLGLGLLRSQHLDAVLIGTGISTVAVVVQAQA